MFENVRQHAYAFHRWVASTVCVQRVRRTHFKSAILLHSGLIERADEWVLPNKPKLLAAFFKDSDILNIPSGCSLGALNFVFLLGVKQHSGAKHFQ